MLFYHYVMKCLHGVMPYRIDRKFTAVLWCLMNKTYLRRISAGPV